MHSRLDIPSVVKQNLSYHFLVIHTIKYLLSKPDFSIKFGGQKKYTHFNFVIFFFENYSSNLN